MGEHGKLFGENERGRFRCVQGSSVIGFSRALLESIYGVTSDISIIRFEYSTSPRAISRFLDSLKCYYFT